MKARILPLILLALVVATASCKKQQPETKLQLKAAVNHHVAGAALVPDTIAYLNAAGNEISVTRLQYYLSDFELEHEDGRTIRAEGIHYVDMRKAETFAINLGDVPEGNYTALSVYIGIPPAKNISYSLPPTTDNMNMAWPENMGGGYHFLKLEGHFIDTTSLPKGYALHLGENGYVVHISWQKNFTLTGPEKTLSLEMDVAEWFTGPHTWDLPTLGTYSMGVDSLMGLLRDNGHNVLTVKWDEL